MRFLFIIFLLFSTATIAYGDQASEGIAAFQRKDFQSAMTALKPLAEQGDKNLQSFVAKMYLEGGGGVQQDYSEAFFWAFLAGNRQYLEEARKHLSNDQLKALNARMLAASS